MNRTCSMIIAFAVVGGLGSAYAAQALRTPAELLWSDLTGKWVPRRGSQHHAVCHIRALGGRTLNLSLSGTDVPIDVRLSLTDLGVSKTVWNHGMQGAGSVGLREFLDQSRSGFDLIYRKGNRWGSLTFYLSRTKLTVLHVSGTDFDAMLTVGRFEFERGRM